METVAFRMVLHPGMEDEYQRRHDEIWPELAAALHCAGVRDYWIFLDPGTHHLFAVLKAEDPAALAALPTRVVVRQWWDYMADIMQVEPDNSPSQQPLLPMFHLP